jgi:hypothetical protein
VVLVQALSSAGTVAQMAMFAIVLPRGDFDDYAVWVTCNMFLVGLGQAIGTDRVIIGRRSEADGVRSARVIAAAVVLVQLGVAIALQNAALVVCSLAVLVYTTYDFQRFVRCFDEASRFLRLDLAVLAAQVVVTIGTWAVVGDSPWLVLGWWVVGAPVWLLVSGRDDGGLRAGLRVLRDDLRECLPLLGDAALAGVPLVVALALLRAQGAEGDASAARMAFTILGPITVLGISARRMVYQRIAQGPLSAGFALRWTVVVVVTFVGCAALLSLTRTPLYPWAFPGFLGLTWWAIVGFSTNHAAMFSTLLPAATLRAEQRSLQVGVARVAATLAAGGVGAFLLPFDAAADVAWCVAAGSIAYAVSLYVARTLTPRRPPTAASAGGSPRATPAPPAPAP